MRLFSRTAAALLIGAFVATGCTGNAKPPQTPPTQTNPGSPTQPAKHPELVAPFESALLALRAMNEAGVRKDFVNAEKHFREFRTHWATIRVKLKEADPKLEVHIEDGAVELDIEFKKSQDQIRVYELDEETVKLGRLLSDGAETLGLAIKPELVQKDPRDEIPFNKEARVEITITDHKFDPKALTFEQHTKVTFVLTNKGKEMHEFELGRYAVEVEEIMPGETKELTMVLLDAGEFEISCHVPGHYEVGMHGTLKVTPAELKKQ